jgi:hypothetical protein
MELENIMLREVSQALKNRMSHVFPHVWKLDLQV